MKKHIGKLPIRLLAIMLCVLIGFPQTLVTAWAESVEATDKEQVFSGIIIIPGLAVGDGAEAGANTVLTQAEDGGSTCVVSYIVEGSDTPFYKETVDRNTLAYGPPGNPEGASPFIGWFLDGETLPFNFGRRIVTGNLSLEIILLHNAKARGRDSLRNPLMALGSPNQRCHLG